MAAGDVDQNNLALRTYLNVGIVAADIPNNIVNTIDIVRGEFLGVLNDNQFTTGDMYTQFVDLLTTNEQYFTGHVKPFDTAAISPFTYIQNSGKRIVLEHQADVIFSVGMLGIGNQNYQLRPARLRNPCYVGHTVGDVKLVADVELCTAGHQFTEDKNNIDPPPGNAVVDEDNSGNIGNSSPGSNLGLYCRRWYCQRIAFRDLEPGIHHFYVAMSARCDKGHVKVLNSQIEVFYKNIFVEPG
jgi:hypothetical protein